MINYIYFYEQTDHFKWLVEFLTYLSESLVFKIVDNSVESSEKRHNISLIK